MQGSNTILKVDAAVSDSWTTISKRMKLELPEMKRDDVEITDLDSTAKEFEAGDVIESGELSGTLITKLDDASHIVMLQLMESGDSVPWQVQFPGITNAWQFTGYLNKLKVGSAEVNKNYECEFTIKISGVINRSATAK